MSCAPTDADREERVYSARLLVLAADCRDAVMSYPACLIRISDPPYSDPSESEAHDD